jgi:hypothetical protein
MVGCACKNAQAEIAKGEYPMKESTIAKITAAATAAKRTAQKALAANPTPEWTEHEMQSIDEWIAHQDVKIERSEAIRRLVKIGLKAKGRA